MTYETYWSILDTPAKSIRSYDIFLYITVISSIAWLLIKKFKKLNGDIEKSILLWSTGVLFIFSISAFTYLKIYDKDESYENSKRFLESSSVGKIEGEIEDFERFHPTRAHGVVTQESFTIDSIHFSYSDEFLGRFNRFCKTNNNIFRNGLPVRITYGNVQHEILKVEIAK
jgi:hypothetical protein